MSRYFSDRFENLVPYTPGEQPRERGYIKLNTNESPFLPSEKARSYANQAAQNLQLYSDPQCITLRKKVGQLYGLDPEEVFIGNGSDEVLYLAFMAFCDQDHAAAFPDITYGFYKVFAGMLGIPFVQIPLKNDFSIDVADYMRINKTIFIANPNAPTGLILSLDQIEKIVVANPDNVVVIDEAYIDFGGESAIKLIRKYDNLLVTQTFSKSRSLAGGRLGMGFGNPALIRDLRTLKFSINPYNVNSMTLAAGLGALEDEEYTRCNCQRIIENRAYTSRMLLQQGFKVLDSNANFILAGHGNVSGEALYQGLKTRGILVRYFDSPRLRPYVRITIGTRQEMDCLLKAVSEILEEAL